MAQPAAKLAFESDSGFHPDALTEEQRFELRCELCDIDGMLTAVAVSPAFVPPAQWLSALPGDTDAPELPPEAKAFMRNSLDQIHRMLRSAHGDYLPMYMEYEPEVAFITAWAEGFVAGMALKNEAWKAECSDPGVEERLALIALLSADDETLTRLLQDPGATVSPDLDPMRLKLADEVPDCVVWLYRRWHAKDAQDKALEPGRNDPCPCGSGKKYKKCCLV